MMAAERGSIWTVPALGNEARVLIFSAVRGVTRGRPEYQVVPVYVPGLGSQQTAHDFLIRPSENSLNVALYAALWNARPMLQSDLGEQVAAVTSPVALSDLRDAYLRTMDPKISVAHGRLGTAPVSADLQRSRSNQIRAWQPLSGRALQPRLTTQQWTFYVNGDWCNFGNLSQSSIEASERLANTIDAAAIGAFAAFAVICVSMAYRRPALSEPEQTVDLALFPAAAPDQLVGQSIEMRIDPTRAQELDTSDCALECVAA